MSWGETEPASTGLLVAPQQAESLELFHRSLAELCRAEMPLPRALRLVADDGEAGPLGDVARRMATAIEDGASLGEAYELHGKVLPPVYRSLVEAGIEAGDLPDALDAVARHAATRARVADRLRRALAYPMWTALFVVAVAGVLVACLTPVIWNRGADLLAGYPRVTLPPAWLLGLASGGALGLLVLVALVWAWLRAPLDGRSGPSRLAAKLPVIGRLRTLAAKASFASTLALLLRRRVPLPRALAQTAEASAPWLRSGVDAMQAAADGGADLGAALRAGALLPPSLLWLIESGTSTGDAETALAEVAALYECRLDRAIDRAAIVVAPIAEVLIGIVVLLFALSYVLPSMHFLDAMFDF